MSADSLLKSASFGSSRCVCLLLEASLIGIGSLALVKKANGPSRKPPIFVLTSTHDEDFKMQALKAGADEVFEKPLINGRLVDRVLTLVEARRREDDRCFDN